MCDWRLMTSASNKILTELVGILPSVSLYKCKGHNLRAGHGIAISGGERRRGQTGKAYSPPWQGLLLNGRAYFGDAPRILELQNSGCVPEIRPPSSLA